MSPTAAEPSLYEVDDDGAPTLFGLRDSSGAVSYPFQEHGSESTGDHGDSVERMALAGTGTVTSVVRVNVHPDPSVETRYRLASIVLDEGPLVRSVVTGEAEVAIGDRVRAVTVGREEAAGPVAELRFARMHEENA